MREKTLRLTQTALLAALAIVISFIESLLPPIPAMPPGAKPGFSNVITMYAAGAMGLLPALSIAVIKSMFVLLTRGLTAALMSLAGGVLSTLAMYLYFKLFKGSGMIGVGLAGALAHNAAQLLVAYLLTGMSILAYAPWLIIISIVTGSATGVCLKLLMPIMIKINLKG
ncbi:MAG: Gx transporter family protein [Oscillospiraceae bacterium]|jgi:heptaprenyl diphosphate synthase|nr:Gx transporter family protein [Oscillospiraceae bacterium]